MISRTTNKQLNSTLTVNRSLTMKSLFVIISLCTTLMNFAQTFEFDLLTRYKLSSDTFSTDKVVYSNRNNPSYFLQVWKHDTTYKAKLINMESLEVHTYNVTTSGEDNDLMFSFEHVCSEKIKYNKEFYSYNFEIDSLQTPTKISVVKGRRKKKTGMYLNVNVEESHYNLFPLFRVSCFHPFEIRKDLKLNGNYLVRSAEGKNFQGNKCKCELVDFKEIKLVLNVPE